MKEDVPKKEERKEKRYGDIENIATLTYDPLACYSLHKPVTRHRRR